MLKEGYILYFDPFYFKNRNKPKPKYFVVLKVHNKNLILASLPTRKDSVPTDHEMRYGCIELPDINFNCFKIDKRQPVTLCGKSFEFPTYMYGYQLDDYSLESLEEIYPNEGIDYKIWGEMIPNLFNELIDCFKSSKTVKRKYKRILNDFR